MRAPPSIAFLHEALRLDPESGRLYWRERPREHFLSEKNWLLFNRDKAGQLADVSTLPVGRYRRVRMKFRRDCFAITAHRVVFALHHNRWPKHEVDHINRDRQDNRPSNLRDVTHVENMQNISTAPRFRQLAV